MGGPRLRIFYDSRLARMRLIGRLFPSSESEEMTISGCESAGERIFAGAERHLEDWEFKARGDASGDVSVSFEKALEPCLCGRGR